MKTFVGRKCNYKIKIHFYFFILTFIVFFLVLSISEQTSNATNLVWSYNTDNGTSSSPAIGSDGTIYIIAGNYLFAIKNDGSLKWVSENINANPNLSPTVGDNGIVYVPSQDGLYAIYQDNGSTDRVIGLRGGITSDIAISAKHSIYAVNSNSSLYVIRAQNPNFPSFCYNIGFDVHSSPVIGQDGTIYIGSSDGLYAITDNGANCQLKWKYPASSSVEIESTPAIGADGTIYVTGSSGSHHYLYAIRDDGTKKWSFPLPTASFSSPAVGPDGTIYIGTQNNGTSGYLYAIQDNGTNGVLKWKYKDGTDSHFGIDSSPAIGKDGIIYFGSTIGYFYTIVDNGASGIQKWKYRGESRYRLNMKSSPAISKDGTVYITYNTYLYAFLSSSLGLAESPWPKYLGNNQNTGRRLTSYIPNPTNNTYITISVDSGTIDGSLMKAATQALNDGSINTSNMPSSIDPQSVIETNITVQTGSSTQLTIGNLTLPFKPLFYKYSQNKWLDLLKYTDCSFRYQVNQNGAYTISLKITDGGPLDSDGVANGIISDPLVIARAASPSPLPTNHAPYIKSFSASPTTGNAPLDVQINISGYDPDGDAVKYYITFGDGKSYLGAEGKVVHTYKAEGNYDIRACVYDTHNAARCTHTYIDVEPNLPPQITSFTATPTQGVAPLNVTFKVSAEDRSIVSYGVNFGDGSSVESEESTITHTYTTPGIYTATATVEDNYGNRASSSPVQIQVGDEKEATAQNEKSIHIKTSYSTVSDIHTQEALYLPDGMEAPYGAIYFTLKLPDNATSAKVTLTLPDTISSDSRIYKYSDGELTDITNSVEISGNTLTLTIIDNSALDENKESGIIEDPIVVAEKEVQPEPQPEPTPTPTPQPEPTPTPQPSPSSGGGGGGGCTTSNSTSVGLVLILIAGLGVWVRGRVKGKEV